MILENNICPKENEFVILYFDKKDQKIVKLEKDKYNNNKFGYFSYNDFINKPFGTKVFSKGDKGFIYCLPLTKYFWTTNLLHKTQILYSFDISNIIFNLNIKKGDIVVESGTGSGSLSYSLAKRIGKKGKLFSFEFNEERVNNSKTNFENFGLNQVTITHRDVYKNGFTHENLEEKSANAVFIDLPSPWDSVDHINKIIKKGGRLCSFSPCIEQVLKMKEKLSKNGFGCFNTVELMERGFDKKSYKSKIFTFDNNEILLSKRESDANFVPVKSDEKTHTGYLTYCLKFN